MAACCAFKICCLKGLWECIETVLRENLKAQQAAMGQ